MNEKQADWIAFEKLLEDAEVSSEFTKTGSPVDPRFEDLHSGFYTGVKHAKDQIKRAIDKKDIMGQNEAAAYLGVAKRTVSRWAENYSDMPVHRDGRNIGIDRIELLKWIVRYPSLCNEVTEERARTEIEIYGKAQRFDFLKPYVPD